MKINKELLYNYILISIGTLIFVIGIQGFIVPAKLTAGGVNGIAIIFHYLFNMPIGAFFMALNIPLFILGWRSVDHDFIFKTLYAVVLSSLLFGPMKHISFVNDKEMILGAIFGGAVYGVGIGIVFRFGGSLGGTDIISKYLNKNFGLSIGMLTLIINGIIVVLSGLVIGRSPAMYTMIGIFVGSKVIDFVQEGLPTKSIFIVSNKSEEVTREIINQTGRGITVLRGRGAYTSEEKNVILTAVRWEDLYKVKKIVREIDPYSFIIIGNAKEILGKGFTELETI